MDKKLVASCILFSITIIALLGCGTAPRPTPAATLAPVVITVVITATPPPVSPVEPTRGATGTLTTTAGITVTQTLVAARPTNTNTPGTPRATATRRPAATQPPPPTATASPHPIKYPQAVRLEHPVYRAEQGQTKDERHYPNEALIFEWISNQALGAGECYLIRVDMRSNADNSTRGDSFLQCNAQETQRGSAQTVRFMLNRPGAQPGPTYGGIIPPGGGDLTVSWSVTIVKDEGPTESVGAYGTGGSRRNVIPLSPRSNIESFPLKGG